MRHLNFGYTQWPFTVAVLCAAALTAKAQSSATGSISLNSLSVTPAAGNISWSGWTLNALATTLNSDGEFSQNYDFGVNNPGTATTSASVTYASSSVSAMANSLDGSSISGQASGTVSIPGGINESASVSGGYGNFASLDNSFTLSQATQVTFNLGISATQGLMTDAGGQVLEDEVVANLNVDGSPLLFYDNALTLGPDATLDTGTVTPTLNGSLALGPGTYDLYLELFDEQQGLETTPEPADLQVMLICAVGLGMRRAWGMPAVRRWRGAGPARG